MWAEKVVPTPCEHKFAKKESSPLGEHFNILLTPMGWRVGDKSTAPRGFLIRRERVLVVQKFIYFEFQCVKYLNFCAMYLNFGAIGLNLDSEIVKLCLIKGLRCRVVRECLGARRFRASLLLHLHLCSFRLYLARYLRGFKTKKRKKEGAECRIVSQSVEVLPSCIPVCTYFISKTVCVRSAKENGR